MRINGTEFDLNYCKSFSDKKLKAIYNGESQDTIDKLIEAVHGKAEAPEADEPKAEIVEVKEKRKAVKK